MESYKLGRLAPALVWLIFITVLSVMPSVQLPKFDLVAPDKLGHALAYGILAWLGLRGLYASGQQHATPRNALLICLFAAAYGMVMELVQGSFLPGRVFEFDDMIANTVGALVAWALFKV